MFQRLFSMCSSTLRNKQHRVSVIKFSFPLSHYASLSIASLCLIVGSVSADFESGINPKGGGVFVKSEDGNSLFKLYGYAQPQLTATVKSQNLETPSGDMQYGDMRVRRARIDFLATYQNRSTLFLEYDGAPSSATLVEAWTQYAYVDGLHYARAGKFVSPFSAEDMRSSRALITVERYIALNSISGLPAINTQFGLMLWGYLNSAKQVRYMAGVFNGNSNAGVGGNSRDNNGYKDWVTRMDWMPNTQASVGISAEYDREKAQTLGLKSLSGASFASYPVFGDRQAATIDFSYNFGKQALAGEMLVASFQDSHNMLHGGYLQASHWAIGSEDSGGVQPVIRMEYAAIGDEEAALVWDKPIVAVTVGANLWANGWTRLQLNLVNEYNLKKGSYSEKAYRPTLLGQFQVKF